MDQVKAAKFEVSEGRESLRYKLETEAAHAESYPCTRVLLVEDNAINRLLAVRLLEKKGYHVTATAAGMEALAALERDCFQLVLTDVQMPNMDGFELTKTIREKEQATRIHLPIIAITAHAGKEDREACLAAGMDGYISKPISASKLFEVIDRTLAARSVDTRDPGARRKPESDRPAVQSPRSPDSGR